MAIRLTQSVLEIPTCSSKTVRSLTEHVVVIVASLDRAIFKILIFGHMVLLDALDVRVHAHVADLLVELVHVPPARLHQMKVPLLLHINILVLSSTRKATEPATLFLLGL